MSIGLFCAAVSLLRGTVAAESLSQELAAEGAKALAQAAREEGNAVRGAILFHSASIACGKCHAPGKDLLGPDLTTIDEDAADDEQLVESLLFPSKVIKEGFESVIVLTNAGKMITGRVVQRNPRRLVLDDPTGDGRRITLAMDDLDVIESSRQSIMPDGLIDQLSDRRQFLDVTRYVMQIAAGGPSQSAEWKPMVRAEQSVALSAELRGIVLLGELGCLACHADASGSEVIRTKQGPDLSEVGGRINPYYIQRFIADPSGVKPHTTMPDLTARLDADARQEAAQAITQYLVSLGSQTFQPQAADRTAVPRGRSLFHSVGCVACHSPRDDHGLELIPAGSSPGDSVPLGRLDEKYSLDSLLALLKDPHAVRPSDRMPDMRLTHWEARDVASYLLKDARVAAALRYTVYQGEVSRGFDRLADKECETGLIDGFTLVPLAAYRDHYTLRFQGFLRITRPGPYTFLLNGGRLSVDGRQVISLATDAADPSRLRRGAVTLTAGAHAIELVSLQINQGGTLDLQMEGPGLPNGPLPRGMLSAEFDPPQAFRPFPLDPALVAQGKKQFGELGCAQCHQTGQGASRQPDKRGYPSLDRLRADQGCLSGKAGPWPRYQLDESSRDAILAALARRPKELTDEQRIALDLTRFNCLACHRRGQLGGVSALRVGYFQSADHNLGEQGRIPPPLTGVGAKLRPKWIRDVLVNGRTVRPYMRTRMPRYAEENVAGLLDLFERTDRLPDVTFPTVADEKEMRQTGLQMAGSQGLNCVACHLFKQKQSETMPAVDLVEMAERLKKEWFTHYMVNPQQFSPNTVMPSFFPGGRSVRDDILDGDTSLQVEALWLYLQDGRQANTPRGLVREPMELVVAEEAVMLRRSYQGIGKRGIGVGYPNRVNLAFDAEQMRLAMIWKGKFVDPAGAWSGQGSGTARPLGTDLIRFPLGPEVDDATNPWSVDELLDMAEGLRSEENHQPQRARPPHHKFLGYTLDDKQRPTFLYQFENVRIEDYALDPGDPDSETALIRRTLTFQSDSPRANVVFRAAQHERIIAQADGRFLVGEKLRIRVISPRRGRIVETTSGQQLRVPLDIPAGKSTLVLEYTW